MIATVSVEQRLRRLDELIEGAEVTVRAQTRIALERPGDDDPECFAVMDAMWASMDFLAALRVEKMNLLLG